MKHQVPSTNALSKVFVIASASRGRVHYRSNTHKRIFMTWCYGASTKGLARRYGWRRVNEVVRAVSGKQW